MKCCGYTNTYRCTDQFVWRGKSHRISIKKERKIMLNKLPFLSNTFCITIEQQVHLPLDCSKPHQT